VSVIDRMGESASFCGAAPPRHIDGITAELDMLARSWLDVQQTRKALAQRALPEAIVASFTKAETQLSRRLTTTLREHVLWPWLAQFPGLGGAHTALIIGRIGDPRRFPGQRCSAGHYLPPLYEIGQACPVADNWIGSEVPGGDGAAGTGESELPYGCVAELRHASGMANSDVVAGADEGLLESEKASVCPGIMLAPRTTTGVRSLWHWAGLHALENGRAPRKTKGVQADWEPRARASVMQPGGIAEQIVRLSVPHYCDVYRSAKERLCLRVVSDDESEHPGAAQENGRATEHGVANEGGNGRPLRLFEADRIARKVAAKEFLGDLLVQWKALALDGEERSTR
jgi:hypothetical protein